MRELVETATSPLTPTDARDHSGTGPTGQVRDGKRATAEAQVLEGVDAAAIAAWYQAEATPVHDVLASRIWQTARTLGVTPGEQALALGSQARTWLAAGMRPAPRFTTARPDHAHPAATPPSFAAPANAPQVRHDWQDRGWREHGWQAQIPPHLPDQATPLVPAGHRPDGSFALVLINTPLADVRLRLPANLRARRDGAARTLTLARHVTVPGGLIAAVVPHDLLDTSIHPGDDPGEPAQSSDETSGGLGWPGIGHGADFLGAVRLPSGALRAAPDCDAPVDVVFLRRNPAADGATGPFRAPGVAAVPGEPVPSSGHYVRNPRAVLGVWLHERDRFGQSGLYITDPAGLWPLALNSALNRLVAHTHATDRALAAGTPAHQLHPATEPPHPLAPHHPQHPTRRDTSGNQNSRPL